MSPLLDTCLDDYTLVNAENLTTGDYDVDTGYGVRVTSVSKSGTHKFSVDNILYGTDISEANHYRM